MLVFAGGLPAVEWRYPGLWLKVSEERAPAGGVVQLQITLTEPKPIIRTRMDVVFDEEIVEEIMGVAIFSEGGNAAGMATRRGNVLTIQAASPDASFGYSDEYPIITITARLRPAARPGARGVFSIDPKSDFRQPDGSRWDLNGNEAGGVTVDGGFWIEDVVPANGPVAAGQAVRILGHGFKPWSKVAISGAPALRTEYVSPTELRVVSGAPFEMDQRYVHVVAPDQNEKIYYPYLRGVNQSPSDFDLISASEPLFSHKAFDAAVFDIPASLSRPGGLAGVAVQNPNPAPVAVWFNLYDESGVRVAAAWMTLLPGERLVKELSEIYRGFSRPEHTALRVWASGAIQVMAFGASPETGEVTALLPETAGGGVYQPQ
ncbi:MAG: IPT/TIG domain-containing protein [Candidatus Solibacter usitatus]|nr:IPT/TIG domain-containing protein [Candidatus Solibacter usitatus]